MRPRSASVVLVLSLVLAISGSRRVADAAPSGAVGVLDAASWTNGSIAIAGWAFGEDDAPVTVHVHVDGRFAATTVTGGARPDVSRVFAGRGAASGFTTSIATAAGSHTVCAYALTADGRNPLLGCRSVTVPVDPVGTIDVTSLAPGGVVVRGWAVDPDATAASLLVHVYVDGVHVATGTANGARPDVDRALGVGAAHGYAIAATVGAGRHRVCAYGINVTGSAGTNALLACRDLDRTGDPVGYVTFVRDSVAGAQTSGDLVGYLVDPDTSAPLEIHIYIYSWSVIEGRLVGAPKLDSIRSIDVVHADDPPPSSVPAEAIRPLVETFGSLHGFSARIGQVSGITGTCVYAVNAVGTPGHNFLLGCEGFTEMSPLPGAIGAFE